VVLFDTIRLSLLHAEAIVIVAVIAVALHLFLSRSRLGRSMRAVADEPELAAVAGLDTKRVIRWTWIIGASLAATAGVISGLDTDIHPNMGWNLILPMFAATILGGIGKPMGALAGGLLIGLAEELSTYNWIGEDALVSPSYKTAVAFMIMVVLLIVRPQGLFKGRLL
jgi:branched-subunit amino acid ABC-type transport system permease component